MELAVVGLLEVVCTVCAVDGRREEVETREVAERLNGFFNGGSGGAGSDILAPLVNAFLRDASDDLRMAVGAGEGATGVVDDLVNLGVVG